jgi:hypothetical protein
MLSLVLVSLLSMAKLGDAYLEVLDRVAQERLRFKNLPEMPGKENVEVADAPELSLLPEIASCSPQGGKFKPRLQIVSGPSRNS